MKKILAIILTTMLIVSLVPMSVFAADEPGAISALTFNSENVFSGVKTAALGSTVLTADDIAAATVVVPLPEANLDDGQTTLISATGASAQVKYILNPTETPGTSTTASIAAGTAFASQTLAYGDVIWVIDGDTGSSNAAAIIQYVKIVVSMPTGGNIGGNSSVKSPFINVVLPINLNFALDPSQMVNGAADGNQIASGNYVVKNLSDAKVLVGFTLTATAASPAALVAAPADLAATRYDTTKTAPADKKAFFGVVPANSTTAATSPSALTFTGLNIATSTYGYDKAKVVKFDTASSNQAKLSFLLDAPASGTTLSEAGVGAFELYAEMNAYAPWASGDITVAGTWTIASLAAQDTGTAKDAATLNMVSVAPAGVEATGVAGQTVNVSLTGVSHAGLTTPMATTVLNLYFPAKPANITSVTFKPSNTVCTPTTDYTYDAATGVLTFIRRPGTPSFNIEVMANSIAYTFAVTFGA